MQGLDDGGRTALCNSGVSWRGICWYSQEATEIASFGRIWRTKRRGRQDAHVDATHLGELMADKERGNGNGSRERVRCPIAPPIRVSYMYRFSVVLGEHLQISPISHSTLNVGCTPLSYVGDRARARCLIMRVRGGGSARERNCKQYCSEISSVQ